MFSGADPGFQVRGGALKIIASSGGRHEHFWGISCEKSRIYAKKSYFFQLRREGGAKIVGVFRVKNHDFTPKIIFFPILGGREACAPPPPPRSAPGFYYINDTSNIDGTTLLY